MSTPMRVVLDVDVGADDGIAILMLLFAESIGLVKVEGITCVNGNTDVDKVVKNVVRILEAAERTDINVYKGASSHLIQPKIPGDGYYGEDGFGDLKWSTEPNMSIVKNDIASIFLGQLARENPGEIYFLTCGPLTNLALTMKLFPDFTQNAKEIYVMGGNHHAIGNISPSAEFNFYLDPEAAEIVFQETKKRIRLLTWETTLDAAIDLNWRFDVFGAIQNPVVQMLTRVDHTIFPSKSKIWKPADAFLVGCFMRPSLILRQNVYNASVELNGSRTRGQVVIDRIEKENHNIVLIESIDREAFKELLLEVANHTKKI